MSDVKRTGDARIPPGEPLKFFSWVDIAAVVTVVALTAISLVNMHGNLFHVGNITAKTIDYVTTYGGITVGALYLGKRLADFVSLCRNELGRIKAPHQIIPTFSLLAFAAAQKWAVDTCIMKKESILFHGSSVAGTIALFENTFTIGNQKAALYGSYDIDVPTTTINALIKALQETNGDMDSIKKVLEQNQIDLALVFNEQLIVSSFQSTVIQQDSKTSKSGQEKHTYSIPCSDNPVCILSFQKNTEFDAVLPQNSKEMNIQHTAEAITKHLVDRVEVSLVIIDAHAVAETLKIKPAEPS